MFNTIVEHSELDELSKLRLHDLRTLCDRNGLKYRPTARGQELATLLRGMSISLDFNAHSNIGDSLSKFEAPTISAEAVAEAEAALREDLSGMDHFKFLAFTKQLGIKVEGALTKEKRDEIIDKYIDDLKGE